MKKLLKIFGLSSILSLAFLGTAFAAASITSIQVSGQSNTLNFGKAGSATYTVTVNRTGNGSLPVDLSISSLPSGVTASFSPASLSFTGSTPTSLTSTLTISITTSASGGTFPFTVSGTDNLAHVTSSDGSATLYIYKKRGYSMYNFGSNYSSSTDASLTANGTSTDVSTSTLISTSTLGDQISSSTSLIKEAIQKFKFERDLKFGDKGDDVKELQERLRAEGFFTASSTGFFGKLTKAAVILFQEKHLSEILSKVNLLRGTGFVSRFTKDLLNQ
jgi:hypothetical protein